MAKLDIINIIATFYLRSEYECEYGIVLCFRNPPSPGVMSHAIHCSTLGPFEGKIVFDLRYMTILTVHCVYNIDRTKQFQYSGNT